MTFIRVAHLSLQFSDSEEQQAYDIQKLFKRAQKRSYRWITGGEAGPGAGNMNQLLHEIGTKAGYRLWIPSLATKQAGQANDSWIAVQDSFMAGAWRTYWEPVIPGSAALYEKAGVTAELPKWGPKGLCSVQFENSRLGEINVATAHYLRGAQNKVKGKVHGISRWDLNLQLQETIRDWAIATSRGRALSFYGGDQNLNDRKEDTFGGGPMLSVADELRAWQNTGYGPIDVMASCSRDGRVQAEAFRVFDDSEVFLHTDHHICEAIYKIRTL